MRMMKRRNYVIHTPEEIVHIREAARAAALAREEIAALAHPGMSTLELDELAGAVIRATGGIPTFLNYSGFPRNICISVNDVVVHGIASEKCILKEGDLVSVDVGVTLNGGIGMKLDAVILFEAPEDLLLQRLTARLTCKKCGVAFNKLFAPPKQEGICDRCGGELIQRADDSLETAKNRLKVYHEQTAPLIQFYEGKGCLARIDSSLPVDEGFAALLALLK